MPGTKVVWKIRNDRRQLAGSVCFSCVLYLRRGQILQRLRSEGPGEKFASQDGTQVFGHDGLLIHRAVIFQGQD